MFNGNEVSQLTAADGSYLFSDVGAGQHRVAQDLQLGDAAVFEDALFFLDYGMKPGALDLEKETIARYHGELEAPGFVLNSLKITQRVYVFGDGGSQVSADRFVRDIVNPAIHTWNVSDRRSA